MHLGLLTADGATEWHTRRLLAALEAHGEVERIDPSGLRVVCGREAGRDVIDVVHRRSSLMAFDVVVLGNVVGPMGDEELQLDAARALDLAGVPCLNRVEPMLAARDKLRTALHLARAGVPTPVCSSVPRPDAVRAALSDVGEAVAKPLCGSLGEGLFRCSSGAARRWLTEAVESGPYLVQRWVERGRVDYRLFVVDGRVEACIERRAMAGEWRANASRGARVIPFVPGRRMREIAVEAARALDLEVAGVDLALDEAGPTVLEVNGRPSFRALFKATGKDMARPIAKAAVRRARTNRQARRERTASA